MHSVRDPAAHLRWFAETATLPEQQGHLGAWHAFGEAVTVADRAALRERHESDHLEGAAA